MKNKLYEAMKEYCEHFGNLPRSAKQWNECLKASYSGATFTALVRDGRLSREQSRNKYFYLLALTDEAIELEKQNKIKNARWKVEHYDEIVARIKVQYEEQIEKIKNELADTLAWEETKLIQAQEFLNSVE